MLTHEQTIHGLAAQLQHDIEACADCHAWLRRVRATLQDGEVACDGCGDLGYLYTAHGPDQCAAPGCAAGSRWGSVRALRAIADARARVAARTGGAP